jgi:lipopolysaccharide transport system permease protein
MIMLAPMSTNEVATRPYREWMGLLSRNRELTWEMTRREVTDRYARQFFGPAWAVIHPLLLIGIYVFLFGFVFQVRIGGTRETPLDYTSYLLAGLIPWLCVQEVLVKSTTALSSNANLVKQVVFPIEVLPVKTVLASLLTFAVSLGILVLYVLGKYHSLHLTYVLLPPLAACQLLWMLGLAYLLSAVGAFVRDTKDVVQVLSIVVQYLMPIFYLPSLVPAQFRLILYVNPFSYLIWCYQDALYFGRFEHPWAWLATPLLALASLALGYRLFRQMKAMFGGAL